MSGAVSSRRSLLMVWVVAAVLFGGLLAVARAAEGPLDDRDPALQRPGFLDVGPLPVPAAPVTGEVPAAGRRAVVFFTRRDRFDGLCHALASHDLEADVVVVAAGADAPCAGDISVVDDPASVIAEQYGMRAPRGGGAPVGYAVVDGDGLIRYRTLDPTVHEELAEVDTVLGALP